MRIYITGSVGSGKSTLARKAAERTGIPCRHLDEVVFTPSPENRWGNQKRPEAERDALFQAALNQDSYIVEDTGRACFLAGMERADQVVLLDIAPCLRRYRILRRWIRQRLGLEKCGYKPRLLMLRAMFRWAREYETGRDGTRARAEKFSEKLIVLRNRREIEAYLDALPHALQEKGDMLQ